MKKIISKLYNHIALSSPRSEVFLRKLYWKNVGLLSSLSPNKSNRIVREKNLDFSKVIGFLSANGVVEGSNIVVHSSYGNLKPISLSPTDVVNELIRLVGENGTIAMPVIRKFDEDNLSLQEQLDDKISDIECTYNVKSTKVTSGILAINLMNMEGSVTSRFPLNPLTANGPLAKEMMQNNLSGELPSPHGQNSSWKFCADHDAYVVYIGVDFGHHVTMQQVVAECDKSWAMKDFYLKRKFKIIDGDVVINKTVKERRLKWTINLAEKNVRKELLKEGVVKATTIDGMPVSLFKACELIEFYRNHPNSTFPYYV